jgi:KDO2-lipid IV(A) lauroyltransferase
MNRFARVRQIVQRRVEYAVFSLVVALIRALPLETASRWSGLGWRAVASRLWRHKRALDNLALALPEKSAAERERIALDMWENLGRSFAEFFHLREIDAEDRLIIECPERVRAMVEAGPFVICGLHMGNWELLGLAALRLGVKLTGVYRKIANPLVDRAVYELRAPLYPGGLVDKSPAAARVLLGVARTGGRLALLADLREGRGAPAMFFGRMAPSNAFPALIARASGLPLYAARILRLPGVRFSLRIERVEFPVTADRDADVRAATEALQARFEAFIREAPEQWTWAHRRWG